MVTTRKKARGGKAKAGVIKRAPKKTEAEEQHEAAATTVLPEVRVGDPSPNVPTDLATDVDMTAPRLEVSQSPLDSVPVALGTPSSDIPMQTPISPPAPLGEQKDSVITGSNPDGRRLSNSSNVSSRRGSQQKSPRGSLVSSSPRAPSPRVPSPTPRSPRASASPMQPATRSPRGSITPKPSPTQSPRPSNVPEIIQSPSPLPAPEGGSPKESSRRNSDERRPSVQSNASK